LSTASQEDGESRDRIGELNIHFDVRCHNVFVAQ
jgi:hypothetical protein